MFLCTSHGYIQFPVYNATIYFVFKYVVRKETELVILLHGEAIDYILSLGALITLHSIDCNVVQQLYPVIVNSLSDCCNLVPIWNDYTNGSINIEAIRFLYFVYLHNCCCNHLCFGLVDLIRYRIPWLFSINEDNSTCFKQVCNSILTIAIYR